MKRKQEKPAYDRVAAGERLRCRRVELGWNREMVAERLGVVNKYYADIERGTCGMSIETFVGLSRLYGMSLDALIYGDVTAQEETKEEALLRGLARMPQTVQDYCLRMMWLFADGIQAAKEETLAAQESETEQSLEKKSGKKEKQMSASKAED